MQWSRAPVSRTLQVTRTNPRTLTPFGGRGGSLRSSGRDSPSHAGIVRSPASAESVIWLLPPGCPKALTTADTVARTRTGRTRREMQIIVASLILRPSALQQKRLVCTVQVPHTSLSGRPVRHPSSANAPAGEHSSARIQLTVSAAPAVGQRRHSCTELARGRSASPSGAIALSASSNCQRRGERHAATRPEIRVPPLRQPIGNDAMHIRKFAAVLAIAGTYLLSASCGGDDVGGGPPTLDGGVRDGGPVPPPPFPPPPYVNSPGSNGR